MGGFKRGIIVVMLILFSIALIANSRNVTESDPWHPLSQIARSYLDKTSVDSNDNGVVDSAENATRAKSLSSSNGIVNVSSVLKLADVVFPCDSNSEGALRYNSTSKKIEFCNGTSWGELTGTQIEQTAQDPEPSSEIILDLEMDAFPFVDSSSFDHTIGNYGVVQESLSADSSKSAYFDSSNYLTIADDPQFTFGIEDFTIEYWIYLKSARGTVFQLVNSNTNNEFKISTDSSGYVDVYYIEGGSTKIGSAWDEGGEKSTEALSLNTWHHVAITRSGNDWKIYLDGQEKGDFSVGVSLQDFTKGPTIGKRNSASYGRNLNGYLDNLKVTKGVALEPSQFNLPPSRVYAVLNENDKSSTLTISNGGLTANHASGGWTSVRANQGKNSGKWYYEVKISSTFHVDPGLATSSATLGINNDCRQDSNSYVLYTYPGASDQPGNDWFYTGSSRFTTTLQAGSNSIVKYAVDLDNNMLWVGVNGAWHNSGNPSSGINPTATIGGGIYYPYMCGERSTNSYANFGQNSFSYSVPEGFNPGWFEYEYD